MDQDTIVIHGRSYPRHPAKRQTWAKPSTRFAGIAKAMIYAMGQCGPQEKAMHLAIVKILGEAEHLALADSGRDALSQSSLPWMSSENGRFPSPQGR